ncbi:MAG: FkbM family methyltransferase [Microcoleaceae cyanobacterium]
MTISCRDSESIPKVPNAGAVEIVDGKPVQIMHNGLKVSYGGYHGDWTANIIHGLRGHHEPQEEKAFNEILRYCRPKTCILELGAFWAYYSMWYLKSIPFSAAYCLEADANHIAVGQENMRLNGLDAGFVHACVDDQFIEQRQFDTESGESVTMPQHTVPSVMAHFRLDEIEILHADVQGSELGLLSSCTPLFAAGKIRFVVVSTHHVSISGSSSTHTDCVALLKANGANILCEHDEHESFSGDGLIVAAMRPEDNLIPPIVISRCPRNNSLYLSGYYQV